MLREKNPQSSASFSCSLIVEFLYSHKGEQIPNFTKLKNYNLKRFLYEKKFYELKISELRNTIAIMFWITITTHACSQYTDFCSIWLH